MSYMCEGHISKQTLQRMPYYLQKLMEMKMAGKTIVSAPLFAQLFGYTEIQVRKDLASVSKQKGKPKVGFEISSLITDIQTLLGYRLDKKAVLLGAGSLGKALIGYKGFSDYGIEIVAAFDTDKQKAGMIIDGRTVFPVENLHDFCVKNNIIIGIITVPQSSAQDACDNLVNSGIKAIWNFAQLHLNVPEGILVQNENMAASLALLFKHLKETQAISQIV